MSVWNTDGMIVETQFFIKRLAIRNCLPRQIELHCASKPDLFDCLNSFFFEAVHVAASARTRLPFRVVLHRRLRHILILLPPLIHPLFSL